MGSRSMREMPAFLRKRFETYRDVRVARDWGGRNIERQCEALTFAMN
jgi:hypothetical protein